jgi:hypothetical protein
MFTGATLLLYFAMPIGLFMDRFGSEISFFASAALVVVPYAALPYCSAVPGLFLALFLIMALGSCALVVVSMHIALSRSPASIKGVSVSAVSASLCLSFGVFLEIFKAGVKSPVSCIGSECIFSGFQLVSIVVCCVVVVLVPASFWLFRVFPQAGDQTIGSVEVLKDVRVYILLVAEAISVYDGMLVVQAGSNIWHLYGRGYTDGAAKWGTAFSVTSCVMTILLSALLDFILHKSKMNRAQAFACFWLVFLAVPLVLGIVFRQTDSETGFGIITAMMGIPFGFGLTQVPALVSDVFGNDKFGFAFGIVQFGAIAAAATLPVIERLGRIGVMVAFFVAAAAHIAVGLGVLFGVKMKEKPLTIASMLEGTDLVL